MLCGINLARILAGDDPLLPPEETMLGGLLAYVHNADSKRFQPMNANFGLLKPLPRPIRDKKAKRHALAKRALAAMSDFVEKSSGVTV